jgi:hypothetical protein
MGKKGTGYKAPVEKPEGKKQLAMSSVYNGG